MCLTPTEEAEANSLTLTVLSCGTARLVHSLELSEIRDEYELVWGLNAPCQHTSIETHKVVPSRHVPHKTRRKTHPRTRLGLRLLFLFDVNLCLAGANCGKRSAPEVGTPLRFTSLSGTSKYLTPIRPLPDRQPLPPAASVARCC